MSTDKNIDQTTKRDIKGYNKILKQKGAVNVPKFLIGWGIFLVIFVFAIPFVLFKYKYYNILEAYLPNLDLIATVLSWKNGPYNIWKHLYPSPIYSYTGYISQTIINYMALLGLTYIITRETKKTNNHTRGWSMAFVMLLMTYLLPAQFISMAMDNTSDLLKNKYTLIDDSIIFLVGLIVTIIVISAEAYVLKNYHNILEHGVKKIMKIPKLLKK
mgnify:FL=1|jgi:hypothetical protein